ncbi:MAG: UDP-glucose/GDP-mannose dehydrogenase family protein [Actinobacteria bacterium]|nr:MAG: UDP-glucose/GDP-mannose dehydrogenase family protein [Actinomycetota bacterium]
MKKVSVIGTGYVGLVSGACFEHLGHQVLCIDKDEKKIAALKDGKCPIHEEGLEELLKKADNLSFDTDISRISESEIIFICVGTPEKENGDADLSYVYSVCEEIAGNLGEGQTVVAKSTIPVDSISKIKEILRKSNVDFNFASNPEFLAQGTAVKDFLEPDRVVIGSETEEGGKELEQLYQNMKAPIVKTDVESAIMIKYAANTFLATKVSFINSIARLCEKVGANVNDVAKGMGMDKRIGTRFLKAGIGYGGSCFTKDTKALIKTASKNGLSLDILKEVNKTNEEQRKLVIEKLRRHLGDLTDKQISMFGLAFKPGTDDLRDAPSLFLIEDLNKKVKSLTAFDPVIKELNGFDGKVSVKKGAYEAVEGADALVFVTEHPEFNDLDFERIKSLVKGNVIIDGRNFLDAEKLRSQGFIYEGIGV